MDTKKLLDLCAASLNYTEGSNNDTTFGKWFGLNNQPWCAMSGRGLTVSRLAGHHPAEGALNVHLIVACVAVRKRGLSCGTIVAEAP